jgi:hypothetical protein
MAIEKLKRHISPGIDQIQAEMFEAGGRKFRSEIRELIISIWNKEEIPEEWKESIIVSIHKKGNKTVCTNYRGITMVYADDVNILGGSIHTLKKNTETLLIRSKEIGLEVNADKTKYMVMSQDRTAERSHNTKNDNNSLERVEQFIYLGRTITNQNFIQEEIKSRLKSGNACYHSVQQLLSCTLLSKNIKIEMYRNIIFPVVLYGCET